MPAVVNNTLGSFSGISEALPIKTCFFSLKKNHGKKNYFKKIHPDFVVAHLL